MSNQWKKFTARNFFYILNADPDPSIQMNADLDPDPDPQHWLKDSLYEWG
jgi:hypothetical protein